MYGIVNKAVRGLITEEYGQTTWALIREKSGIETDIFLSNTPYDDSVTYGLVGAAAEVLNKDASEILLALGEYWILRTGMENYGSMLEAGGNSLKEFLVNLPNFHSRIMLMFPELTPPEFLVSDTEENSLHLHYYSHREGLQSFVEGLMYGIGKMYKTEVQVEHIHSKENPEDHDIFKVSW